VYELNIARKSLVFQTKALSEKVAAGITAFVFDSAGVPWAADRIAGGSQPPGPGTIYNFDVSTQMAGLAYSFSEQLYAELCAGAIDRNAAWKCDLWNGARVRIGG
jgi:hypothetical protein